MSLTVDATYENGTLRLAHPLPLKPHELVRVTVEARSPSIVEAYGIMGWTGDHETLRKIAEDPEFDPLERS